MAGRKRPGDFELQGSLKRPKLLEPSVNVSTGNQQHNGQEVKAQGGPQAYKMNASSIELSKHGQSRVVATCDFCSGLAAFMERPRSTCGHCCRNVCHCNRCILCTILVCDFCSTKDTAPPGSPISSHGFLCLDCTAPGH